MKKSRKMKKYLVRGILSVVLTIITLCGVIIGVPRIMDYIDTQLSKREYRVEELPVYAPADIDKNYLGKNDFNKDISENSISVNSVSGNSVSENIWHGSSVSENNLGGYNFVTVGDDYFNDALFIGDSRTVGLREYSSVSQADYYAATGLTIYKVLDSEIVSLDGSADKISIDEALQQKEFGKIYIMLGINEMGTGTVDSFMEKYTEVVNRIRELQPNAIIFVQGIMQVSAEYSGLSDYIHNQGISERNARLAQLVDGQHVFYIDINPLVCDDNGGLIEYYTTDGVHLKAEYISIWTDFFKSRGIVK